MLHLLLTLLTLGLWSIEWFVLGIRNAARPTRCTRCGTAITQMPAALIGAFFPCPLGSASIGGGESAYDHPVTEGGFCCHG